MQQDKVRVRGFEVVAEEFRTCPGLPVELPQRKTTGSAGYDFTSLVSREVKPQEIVNFPLDVKVYMPEDEVLIINVRSSIGFKKKLRLINTQAWIDSDFYENPENDGNISLSLQNLGTETVYIQAGERIAQGMFLKYGVKDNDEADEKMLREGGIGSTGKGGAIL